MPGTFSALMRVGIGVTIDRIKLAIRSYVRDRTNQATDTATGYAVAAGLFAAAGIFMLAACLVGTIALFRWIEIKYGMFQAFGAIGALLVLISAICAGVAFARIRRSSHHIPALASRLRVALTAGSQTSESVEGDTSTDPVQFRSRTLPAWRAPGGDQTIAIGLVVLATTLGWAAMRRRA